MNTDEQVPSITLNSDVDIDLGESLILVKNTTGSTILDGKVVMAIGSNGNSGNILVSLHSGLKADAKRTIGIATQNILNDSMGFVTKEGKVKGINTTGSIYGETWVDGDILYVKANGALTKVEPLDSQLKMPIAFVIHAHTNGTLYIRTTGIDENHDRDFINNLVDIHSKTAKTTLVDADEFMTADSTSTFSLKKITWASIKTLLANLFIPKVTSTDNAIVRFNGTTGEVQNSGIFIDDINNLGINTSNPLTRLVISNGSEENIEFSTGVTSSALNGGYIQYIHRVSPSIRPDFNYYLSGGGGAHKFFTNDIERMRIDANGNVGIGVTPSAWGGASNALQIGNVGILNDEGRNVASFSNNSYHANGVYKYIQELSATIYQQYNGAHRWQTAPSGTAGNAITWTNAMTLNNNGNLLVGTTTDNGVDKLQVNGSVGAKSIKSLSMLVGEIFPNTGGQHYILLSKIGDGIGFVMSGNICAESWLTGGSFNIFIRKKFDSNAVTASITGISKLNTQVFSVLNVVYAGSTYVALKVDSGDVPWLFNCTGANLNTYLQKVTSVTSESTIHASY